MGWVILGFFFWLIALVIVALLPSKRTTEGHSAPTAAAASRGRDTAATGGPRSWLAAPVTRETHARGRTPRDSAEKRSRGCRD